MELLEVVTFLCTIIKLYLQSFLSLFIQYKRKSVVGQVVLVTGAGHGIGKEISLEFAKLGAKVVLLDLNQENNESLATSIKEQGGKAFAYPCDVRKSSDIKAVAQKIRKDVGEVDILINNAGVLNGGALLDLEEEHIQRNFDVNILAHFWTVREFLPSMLEKNCGHIVNISSSCIISGAAFLVDYSASKYAVQGFTESLQDELKHLGKPGVKTTLVVPHFVDTGLCKYPFDRFGKLLNPKEVALATVDGVLREQQQIFVPRYLWLWTKLKALLPLNVAEFTKEFMQIGIQPQYHCTEKDLKKKDSDKAES